MQPISTFVVTTANAPVVTLFVAGTAVMQFLFVGSTIGARAGQIDPGDFLLAP